MDTKIFDRVEKKYIITKQEYNYLLSFINQYMARDEYYISDIYNIYFDTDNFDLIIQSIDQPDFKEKIRARSYEGYDKVFLEIKTKLKGRADLEDVEDRDNNLGFKRRVLITHDDYHKFTSDKKSAYDLASQTVEQGTDLQIAREIDYLMLHFNLKPQVFVSYHRESYKGENDLRITFDSDLKYRTENLKFAKNKKDRAYFNNDKCIIMEIKAHGAVPLWLSHALSHAHIYPQQFSKIGSIYGIINKPNG